MKLTIDYPESILHSKLFNGVKNTHMRLLVEKATIRHFRAGDFILKEGDSSEHFFWLGTGRVEVQASAGAAGSQPVVLNSLTKGDVVGEMALLGFHQRTASVLVREDTQVYAWNAHDCQTIFTDHPELGYRVTWNLAHMVGQRLVNMNNELRNRADLLDSKILQAY